LSIVHLIRHAKAKNRLEWTEPDDVRPLTKRGRREALAIAERLQQDPPSRLVSSPYARCIQTLEPLALALDLPIETIDELAEGAGGAAALELVLSLSGDGRVACCTHGDIVYEVVSAVAAAGVPLDGPLEAPVASAWILEVENAQVVSARFQPQPPRR
jgi:8-oxo-dGTP diphosphatase